MWTCPRCRAKVDASYDVCWSCATSREGEEDPTFVRAEDAEPIEDRPTGRGDGGPPVPDDEPSGPPPEFVVLWSTKDITAATLLARHLEGSGVESRLGRDLQVVTANALAEVHSVSVNAEDLPRAQELIVALHRRRGERGGRPGEFPWEAFAMIGFLTLLPVILLGYGLGEGLAERTGLGSSCRWAVIGSGLSAWLALMGRLYRARMRSAAAAKPRKGPESDL